MFRLAWKTAIVCRYLQSGSFWRSGNAIEKSRRGLWPMRGMTFVATSPLCTGFRESDRSAAAEVWDSDVNVAYMRASKTRQLWKDLALPHLVFIDLEAEKMPINVVLSLHTAKHHISSERVLQGGNLPAYMLPLYGREADLGALAGLVSERRLVSIVGAGGIGKTRLVHSLSNGARKETLLGPSNERRFNNSRTSEPTILLAAHLHTASGFLSVLSCQIVRYPERIGKIGIVAGMMSEVGHKNYRFVQGRSPKTGMPGW